MYDLARKFARTDGGDCIWRFIISYSLNCLSLSVLDASLYHCARWSLLFHSHDGIAQLNLQAKGYGFSRIRMMMLPIRHNRTGSRGFMGLLNMTCNVVVYCIRNQYCMKTNKYEHKLLLFPKILSEKQLFFVTLKPILEVISLWVNCGCVRYRPQRK